MKKAAIIISLVFISILGYSQSCLPDGITFTTQEQIDNFQTEYPNCTHIEGYVSIANYPEGTSIENIDGLSNITQIDGGLSIYFNLNLTNLNGLSNLTQIGGGVSIFYNPELQSLEGLNNLNTVMGDFKLGEYELTVGNANFQDLSGLSGLTEIGGSLVIYGNWSLTSLTGLENLSSIGESLVLHDNDNLTDLSALEGLTYIENGLSILDNYHLTSLYGLHNIQSINGPLNIYGNASITSLSELENLTTIEESLYIVFNQSLLNLDGLENITSVNGEITIKTNNVLEDISGIKNINPETITSLELFYNLQLSTCHIQSVCDYMELPDAIINISQNATGCNSTEEVEENCETIGIMEHINSISISPNPANDFVQFNFEKEEDFIIQIYNTNGELIAELKGDSDIIWDCKSVTSGIYFYKVTSDFSSYTGKVIIQ